MPTSSQIRTALTAIDILVRRAAILIMTFLALDHAGLPCTRRKTAVVNQPILHQPIHLKVLIFVENPLRAVRRPLNRQAPLHRQVQLPLSLLIVLAQPPLPLPSRLPVILSLNRQALRLLVVLRIRQLEQSIMIVMLTLSQIRTVLMAIDTLVNLAVTLIMTFSALDHVGLSCIPRQTVVVRQQI